MTDPAVLELARAAAERPARIATVRRTLEILRGGADPFYEIRAFDCRPQHGGKPFI